MPTNTTGVGKAKVCKGNQEGGEGVQSESRQDGDGRAASSAPGDDAVGNWTAWPFGTHPKTAPFGGRIPHGNAFNHPNAREMYWHTIRPMSKQCSGVRLHKLAEESRATFLWALIQSANSKRIYDTAAGTPTDEGLHNAIAVGNTS